MPRLTTKRIYEPAEAGDGVRVLVDRVWPRGMSKQRARIDHWLKQIAPSSQLRTWYGHDVERWDAFRKRYFEELSANTEEVDVLRGLLEESDVTLLYGARDREHNNAVALKEFLSRRRKTER